MIPEHANREHLDHPRDLYFPTSFYQKWLLGKILMVQWTELNTFWSHEQHCSKKSFQLYSLQKLPLLTHVVMSTTQNLFPNLLFRGRWKPTFFKHISSINIISNIALTSNTEAQNDLINLKTSSKWEKNIFWSILRLAFGRRNTFDPQKGDYNTGSVYGSFGVCFVLFSIILFSAVSKQRISAFM